MTFEEFLKSVSPDDKFGIRAELQGTRAYKHLLSLVESYVRIKSNQWISVEDMTPDEQDESVVHRNVLCYEAIWKNTYITQYVNGRFKFEKGSQPDIGKITHWQPLPKPPSEEQRNN